MSKAIVILNSVVCAGTKDQQGNSYCGTYFPQTDKSGARFVGNFFINNRNYTDASGNKVETKNDVIRLTAFSSKNSQRGLAELMASIGVGQSMSFRCEIDTYMGQVFNAGKPIMTTKVNTQTGQVEVDANGNPIQEPLKVQKTGFRVMEIIDWGNESYKTIAEEIAAFNGQVNYNSRPAGWDQPGTPGYAQWERIREWRHAQLYQPGTPSFRKAIVGQNTSNSLTAYANAQLNNTQQPNLGLTFPNQNNTQTNTGTGTGLTLPPGGQAYTAGKLF